MPEYDVILRNGLIVDGSGGTPFSGDVALLGDRIAAVGQLPAEATARAEIDIQGQVVAPGFINMLSWSTESLIEDGRSQSEIRQGVTLEVMGEGSSWGPLNEAMKADGPTSYMAQGDIKYEIEWTTLGEYLEWLEKRGVSCNIASFVGSSTLRIYALGYDNRQPTGEEQAQMEYLLHQAMREGAMGLSAALIYTPACYADTQELTELAHIVAAYDGMYISHIRSEGKAVEEALDELLYITEETGVRSEIYHLKLAGQSNWDKLDTVINLIEIARESGLNVTADMYTYPYSGTGLDACIPPWAHEGGHDALMARLRDPETREAIKAEMTNPSDEWENMYAENSAENILLAGFRKPEMRHLQGKRLAEVARERGTSPKDTVLDLILEDDSRVFTIYFSMSEDNLRRQVALPWVSFCSDAASQATEGVFLNTNPHPRAYGSFARLLAKYVRDEGIIPLEEAVRRLTSFPAANLKISDRGWLREGYYADVVVFDPAQVQDHATPEEPHQYATGMTHVFVNGVQVLADGEHTGAKPGRVVRGPGYQRLPYTYDYPEALHPLVSLDPEYNGTYLEFNIGKPHIPDLIRMAADPRLLNSIDDSASFAPVHAWRRLAQLKATEAIPTLVGLLERENPFLIMEEMTAVMGMMGAPAIAPLKAYLENSGHSDTARSLAAGLLIGVGSWNDGPFFDLCVSIVMQQLEHYHENSPLLNAFLIRIIANTDVDAAELIARLYREKRVDVEIAGTWRDMQTQLGLRLSPEMRRLLDDDEEYVLLEDDEPPARHVHKKPQKKKKAKKRRK